MNELQAKLTRDNYGKLIFSRTNGAGRTRLYGRRCPYTGKLSEPVSRETAEFWVKNHGRVIVEDAESERKLHTNTA